MSFNIGKIEVQIIMKEEDWDLGTWGRELARRMSRGKFLLLEYKKLRTLPKNLKNRGARFSYFLPLFFGVFGFSNFSSGGPYEKPRT